MFTWFLCSWQNFLQNFPQESHGFRFFFGGFKPLLQARHSMSYILNLARLGCRWIHIPCIYVWFLWGYMYVYNTYIWYKHTHGMYDIWYMTYKYIIICIWCVHVIISINYILVNDIYMMRSTDKYPGELVRASRSGHRAPSTRFVTHA